MDRFFSLYFTVKPPKAPAHARALQRLLQRQLGHLEDLVVHLPSDPEEQIAWKWSMKQALERVTELTEKIKEALKDTEEFPPAA